METKTITLMLSFITLGIFIIMVVLLFILHSISIVYDQTRYNTNKQVVDWMIEFSQSCQSSNILSFYGGPDVNGDHVGINLPCDEIKKFTTPNKIPLFTSSETGVTDSYSSNNPIQHTSGQGGATAGEIMKGYSLSK